MLPKKIEQFRYEESSWMRTLDFLQQENIMLKNRLAAIMQYPVDKSMLEKVESYQNIFLSKDAIFAILRHDIKEINRSLAARGNDLNGSEAGLTMKHVKLRQDMEKIENEFSRIRTEFNHYLAEAL